MSIEIGLYDFASGKRSVGLARKGLFVPKTSDPIDKDDASWSYDGRWFKSADKYRHSRDAQEVLLTNERSTLLYYECTPT